MKRISLWLCADEGSSAHTHLSSLVSTISTKHSRPPFPPHITLYSLSTSDIDGLITTCDTFASQHPVLHVTCTTTATHPTNTWMTLVTLVEKTQPLLSLRDDTEKRFPDTGASRSFPTPPIYTPHISLLYDTQHILTPMARELLAHDMKRDILKGYEFDVTRITIMDTSSDNYTEWKILHQSPLTGQTTSTSTSTSTSTEASTETSSAILTPSINDNDDPSHLPYITLCNDFAMHAITNGNDPFGSILVCDGLVLWSAENTENKPVPDITHHAELNLISQASRALSREILKRCILYTSTEPCAMCSGAIYWSCIPTVIYCTDIKTIRSFTHDSTIPCRTVLQPSNSSHTITVIGPVNEQQGIRVHESFWK